MNPLLFLAVALAGGAGAALRLVVDGAVRARSTRTFPYGTHIVNASGSLALGLVTGFAGALLLPAPLAVVLGTGLLGGYTTFSTASFETVRLLQAGRTGAAAANAFGMLVVCAVFGALGLWLGSLAGG